MKPQAIAWIAAGLAMALELTVTFGIPALVPGHSLVHDYISTAGATDSPHPLAFQWAGMIAASLHLVFVVRLWQLDSTRWHRTTVGLFGGFFVFLGLGLAFQCDPGCALETTEAWIHFWFGLAAFLLLGLAALTKMVQAIRVKDVALFAASFALVAFDILLLMSDLTKLYRGLTERLVIVTMMAWSVLWMIRHVQLEVEAEIQ